MFLGQLSDWKARDGEGLSQQSESAMALATSDACCRQLGDCCMSHWALWSLGKLR
jgi:hypothetical protein